jgi:predicted DNA-binding protein YlxM (UPF0122 family)
MSIVKEALVDELKSAIELSKEYDSKIKTAKTKVKSDVYTKKLKKNNKIVADLVIALDKVDKA